MPEEATYTSHCMPCTPIRNDAGTIAFTEHWKIVYVPNQAYLGRVVVSSRRHFAAYEEMTDAEAAEYREILRTLLPALQEAFGVTHFNVAYLMNLAYNEKKAEPAFKEGKPNPHFHWHVIPRYDGPREFFGEQFEDPDFGHSFVLQRKQYLTGAFRQAAVKEIQKHLPITWVSATD